VKDLKRYLQKKGIPSSYHRLKILEYLVKHRTHPTADMIYKSLSKKIPTLSKTTIYTTLKLFRDKGIVKELSISENETRYEINSIPHAHLKCIKCGKIYDIKTKLLLLKNESVIEGHQIEECHLYFKGVCKNCLKKQKEK